MSDLDTTLYGQGLVGNLKPSLGPLKERFKYPPFSVWNTRDEYWQTRRHCWIRLGIKSEVGRAGDLTYDAIVKAKAKYDKVGAKEGALVKTMAGTSIFDPVLCELVYSWWCPDAGIVLDPFSGGSVRGIVASVLGMKYWGCDLRQEQITANINQLTEITTGKFKPKWVCGDSLEMVPNAPKADLIFSCPPYGPLEKYSDDVKDISNMTYGQFLVVYGEIIKQACLRLKDDRFACFVVGNFRSKEDGSMIDFVGDTIRAFTAAGLRYYNDIMLVNAVGTAAIRSNTNFVRGARKVVKTHQNVIVFIKGDPKIAAAAIGFDDVAPVHE